jgi:hypothetical protein
MDRLAGRQRDCFFARSKAIREGMRRVESRAKGTQPRIAVLNPAPSARSDRVGAAGRDTVITGSPRQKDDVGRRGWLYFKVKLIVTFTITATGVLSFVPGLNCHCFRALTAS